MDDKYVVMVEKAMIGVGKAASFEEYWMNSLPILKYIPSWVPGSDKRDIVTEYAPYMKRSRTQPFQDLKVAIVSFIRAMQAVGIHIGDIRFRRKE